MTPQGKNRSLRAQLMRMGWASARRTPGGSVRAVALLLAAALLAVGLSSVVAVYAAYDGINARSAARALQYKDASPDRKTIAHGVDSFDEVDGRQYSVVYLRPVSDEVPRPPGINHWPKPGEAFLSPGLQRALAAEGAQHRFGKVVGTIGDEGLASPGEKYAYANPTDRQFNAEDTYAFVGFGGSGSGASGDVLFIANRGKLLTALSLVLLPVAALVVVAVRMGSDGRDRRTALLSALGGGHRHRAWLNLGESALPVVAGALLGAAPAFLAMTTSAVRLPWINYWLSSVDLRHYGWATALATIAAALGTLLLVCVLHRQGRRGTRRSSRLAARTSRITRWAALACPVLIFATVWGPQQLDPAHFSDLRMKLYNIGVVAVLATFPGAIAYGTSLLGARLAGSVRRTGAEGSLVAGRHMAAHPGVTARLVAGVGIAMVLVSQVQLKQIQFGSSVLAAQETAHRVGQSLLLMQPKWDKASPREVGEVLHQLPADVQALSIYRNGEKPAASVRLAGPCEALKAVKVTCSHTRVTVSPAETDRRVFEALRWSVGEAKQMTVVPTVAPDIRNKPAMVLLVSATGADLPVADIKQEVRRALPLNSADVDVPGGSWLVGANTLADHGRWVIFIGVPGVMVIALTIALANLAEFLRFSRKTAPLSVLSGTRSIYYSTAAWSLLAPMLASIVTSVIVAVWLAAPQENPVAGIELSPGLLTTSAAALAVLSAATWLWGSLSAVRQSSRWRPYGE
ncbi:FtsX-like permease family protein [Streptomyces sp. WZ-12]|uniref:FtsX-like permease family protein n=1 Tax=Streptomyces sp. WZ-12 TaxID=3030210 RepID=UPI0023812C78|nr:hypothetical protein [Streptomyces sp. WZ-12]